MTIGVTVITVPVTTRVIVATAPLTTRMTGATVAVIRSTVEFTVEISLSNVSTTVGNAFKTEAKVALNVATVGVVPLTVALMVLMSGESPVSFGVVLLIVPTMTLNVALKVLTMAFTVLLTVFIMASTVLFKVLRTREMFRDRAVSKVSEVIITVTVVLTLIVVTVVEAFKFVNAEKSKFPKFRKIVPSFRLKFPKVADSFALTFPVVAETSAFVDPTTPVTLSNNRATADPECSVSPAVLFTLVVVLSLNPPNGPRFPTKLSFPRVESNIVNVVPVSVKLVITVITLVVRLPNMFRGTDDNSSENVDTIRETYPMSAFSVALSLETIVRTLESPNIPVNDVFIRPIKL